MITASAVASELRRIADVFDKSPETKLIQPRLSFYFGYADTKEQFLDLAKVFPRPFDKGDGYDHQQYTLKHETDALEVYAAIDRSKVCTLVEEARPARYECVPILSLEEEAALGKS